MGLKADVVVVNEFSVPVRDGKKLRGTRGATPGSYVTRYMARKGATEPLTPIRRTRVDTFVERYMARQSATESTDVHSVGELKSRMRKATGRGGVAFGYGQVSLSDDALRAASADLQRLFESGHTVMKTVISFDHDYLRRNKLVPENLVVNRRGDYRGQLDQMKLRMAVMAGLDRMGRMYYDDLRYIAVIQVDTKHVHAHVAMADAGRGTLAQDGTQRGKIPQKAMMVLRRGIDAWLDEKKHVKHLSSAVGYERRNVTTFVKRWAHQQMLRESLPQFLLACLPEDRRLWRYGSNAKEMRKPNRIVREIVEEILATPGSPLPAAMSRIQRYANWRRKNEGLNQDEWQKLVDAGRERIIERSVNGIYGLLKALPKDVLRVRTPMLEVMGMDYEELAAQAKASPKRDTERDLIGFGFRLRSYSARLRHHTEQRQLNASRAKIWEAAKNAGAAHPASEALYRLFREEEEYHARVQAKYRHLLAFLPASADWTSWVDEVSEYSEKLLSLESLRKDQSLRKMKDPAEAERVGMEVYGQSGGALMSIADAESLGELDRRIESMRQTRERKLEELRSKLAEHGLRLESPEEGAPLTQVGTVVPGAEFDFAETKTLDLHHLRFDFSRDVEVGPKGRSLFVSWARRRQRVLQEARAYLESTGQEAQVALLPVADVAEMNALADTFEAGEQMLPSRVAELVRQRQRARRSRTVQLTVPLAEEIETAVSRQARQAVDELVTRGFAPQEDQTDIAR